MSRIGQLRQNRMLHRVKALIVPPALLLACLVLLDGRTQYPVLVQYLPLATDNPHAPYALIAKALALALPAWILLRALVPFFRWISLNFGRVRIPHHRDIFPEGLQDKHREIGYVYVLSNPAMPGLYKIGYTAGSPYKRLRELDSTGVPSRFKLLFVARTAYAKKIEHQTHRLLSDYRTRGRREFFSAPAETVLSALFAARGHVFAAARRARRRRKG